MIRRILLASAGALALTGAAFAADLPSRAPPPVFLPPPPMWTGFYVGINAGGTWSSNNNVNTATANLDPGNGLGSETIYNIASAALATSSPPLSSNAGFVGGGQIGYNYQFANSWLVGLEADFDGVAGAHSQANQFSTVTPVAPFPITQTLTDRKSLNYLGTVRGRLGWLITPTWLVYGTGGLAYGSVNASTGIVQAVLNDGVLPSPYGSFGSVSSTRIGWTAGGGVEWMFLPNWSAKLEYLYYDLGSVTYGSSPLANFSTVGGGTLFTLGAPVSRVSFKGNVVRAGINYHFNWGAAPVVARY
jgi:outer membrane immunogenic protein